MLSDERSNHGNLVCLCVCACLSVCLLACLSVCEVCQLICYPFGSPLTLLVVRLGGWAASFRPSVSSCLSSCPSRPVRSVCPCPVRLVPSRPFRPVLSVSSSSVRLRPVLHPLSWILFGALWCILSLLLWPVFRFSFVITLHKYNIISYNII